MFVERYKYWNYGSWWQYEIDIRNDNWDGVQFASVDKNNNVIGFLGASINRDTYSVSSLSILNFYDINITFSRDLYQFLYDLLYKYKYRKLNFSVVIGNPAEKMYDRCIKKYGGRVVGIQKEQVKLQDGKYYDVKLYEIINNNKNNNREI